MIKEVRSDIAMKKMKEIGKGRLKKVRKIKYGKGAGMMQIYGEMRTLPVFID